MDKYHLDCLVATSQENVFYLSEFWAWSRDVQTFAILPLEKEVEASLIIPFSYIGHNLFEDKTTWIKDIKYYGTFSIPHKEEKLSNSERILKDRISTTQSFKDAIQALLKTLEEKNLFKARIGLDENNLTPLKYDLIKKELPEADLIFAGELFDRIRSVKTKEEIEYLKRVFRINEEAMSKMISSVKPGISEKELEKIYRTTVSEYNAETLISYVRAAGRGAIVNLHASDYKLKEGDLLFFDLGCILNHYHSDESRNAYLGKPSEKIKNYHSAIVKGEEEAICAIEPGVKASDIFNIAIETVRKQGIKHYARQHCGHGIGIKTYDPPLISPENDTVLEEGMVINIETPYHELGFGCVTIEDAVLVTSHGAEQITRMPKDIFIV
jgi:Xaa-Pro aminopeptidase